MSVPIFKLKANAFQPKRSATQAHFSLLAAVPESCTIWRNPPEIIPETTPPKRKWGSLCNFEAQNLLIRTIINHCANGIGMKRPKKALRTIVSAHPPQKLNRSNFAATSDTQTGVEPLTATMATGPDSLSAVPPKLKKIWRSPSSTIPISRRHSSDASSRARHVLRTTFRSIASFARSETPIRLQNRRLKLFQKRHVEVASTRVVHSMK